MEIQQEKIMNLKVSDQIFDGHFLKAVSDEEFRNKQIRRLGKIRFFLLILAVFCLAALIYFFFGNHRYDFYYELGVLMFNVFIMNHIDMRIKMLRLAEALLDERSDK